MQRGGQILLLAIVYLSSLIYSQGVSGDVEVKENNGTIVTCYYNAMSYWREELGKFEAEDMDATLCDHLIYAYIGLSNRTNKLYSRDPGLDLGEGEIEPDPDPPLPGQGENNKGDRNMIRRTVALRSQNPNLKVSISVTGESRTFSNMVRHIANRTQLITSALEFIQKYDLDGIDFSWEYPGMNDGRPSDDKENFVLFLKEMRKGLDDLGAGTEGGRKYFLTGAFACRQDVIDISYDVPQLSQYLDGFHLMCFDFKRFSSESEPEMKIGHHSPLHSKSIDQTDLDKQLNAEFGVNYFLGLGAPPEKIHLGVSTHARTYELGIPEMHNFYDQAYGLGAPGPFTLEPGVLAYYEICHLMKEEGITWNLGFDYEYAIPYAYSGTTWIGYDNEISAQEKVDFAIEKKLGGIMVQSIDMDDCKNVCGGWYSCPITASIRDRLLSS